MVGTHYFGQVSRPKEPLSSLLINNRIYSYVLGRPQILRSEAFDVDPPPAHNPDGTRNLTNVGLGIMVSLMELLGDAIEKVIP